MYDVFCDLVKKDNERRIRNNQKINDILKQEDSVRFLKTQRRQWLGQLERMDDQRMQKHTCTQGRVHVRCV